MTSASKRQIGGDHYRKLAVQPVDYILANQLGFIEGSIVKYVTRWRDKGGVEDLRKARHMLDLLLEREAPPRPRRKRPDGRQLDIESFIDDAKEREDARDNRSAL